MTPAEAQAWAVAQYGPRGFAHQVTTHRVTRYTVGIFSVKSAPVTRGMSGHSYESAFSNAKTPVDMNHVSIQRVQLNEAMKDTKPNTTQPGLFA